MSPASRCRGMKCDHAFNSSELPAVCRLTKPSSETCAENRCPDCLSLGGLHTLKVKLDTATVGIFACDLIDAGALDQPRTKRDPVAR